MKPNRHRVPRVFLEGTLSDGSVSLNDQQTHYLRRVLRLRPGDPVVLFNGLGEERCAVVETLSRSHSKLRLTQAAQPLPESPLDIDLAPALAKADAMDMIVQKSAELGVQTISPLLTDYSVVRLDDDRALRRTTHWRRIARSACEQCGRHYPPTIHPPRRLSEWLDSLPTGGVGVTLDPGAHDTLHDLAFDTAPRLRLLVGPEGGLSGDDLALADRAGFRRVRLGPRILRAETAALAACALAQSLWGDLGA